MLTRRLSLGAYSHAPPINSSSEPAAYTLSLSELAIITGTASIPPSHPSKLESKLKLRCTTFWLTCSLHISAGRSELPFSPVNPPRRRLPVASVKGVNIGNPYISRLKSSTQSRYNAGAEDGALHFMIQLQMDARAKIRVLQLSSAPISSPSGSDFF